MCLAVLNGCGAGTSEPWDKDVYRGLADGTVLVRSWTQRDGVRYGRLSRIAGDGRTLWERELGRIEPNHHDLAVTDEVVGVPTEAGADTVLDAYALADGAPVWSRKLGPSRGADGIPRYINAAGPNVDNMPSRDIVLQFSDDTLICIDGKSGEVAYRGNAARYSLIHAFGARVIVTSLEGTVVLEGCQVRASRRGLGFRAGRDFVHVERNRELAAVELVVFPFGDPDRMYRVSPQIPPHTGISAVGRFRDQFVLVAESTVWFVERDGRVAGSLKLEGELAGYAGRFAHELLDGELPRFAPYSLAGTHGDVIVDHERRKVVGRIEPGFRAPFRAGSSWYLPSRTHPGVLGVLDGETGKLVAARKSYAKLEKPSQIAGDHVWLIDRGELAFRVDGRTLVPAVRSPFVDQVREYPQDVLGSQFRESSAAVPSEPGE
ncbi:MAG: PQQ-like beta-propeller repeat protein [Deltaproteobacteria bacterium]|nr:PQQ-like beta-propeller repeat protein [Deltaproteobacteria bacterium]